MEETPTLQPPSSAFCRSRVMASASSAASPSCVGSAAASPTGHAFERRGPRLFDPHAGDPTDPTSFFAPLANYVSLRGLDDEEVIARRNAEVRRAQQRVVGLSALQTACAAVMLATHAVDGSHDSAGSALIFTSAVVAAAGVFGVLGGSRRGVWALAAFEATQIWVLAAIAAQWLRAQQASARERVFCEEREAARLHGGHEDTCGIAPDVLRFAALIVALLVVYASMFFTDLLAEQLQDTRETEDQRALIHFAWLMHKKTLVGVQRFEDLIHAKFEELVLLGFLKPRPTSPRRGRAR